MSNARPWLEEYNDRRYRRGHTSSKYRSISTTPDAWSSALSAGIIPLEEGAPRGKTLQAKTRKQSTDSESGSAYRGYAPSSTLKPTSQPISDGAKDSAPMTTDNSERSRKKPRKPKSSAKSSQGPASTIQSSMKTDSVADRSTRQPKKDRATFAPYDQSRFTSSGRTLIAELEKSATDIESLLYSTRDTAAEYRYLQQESPKFKPWKDYTADTGADWDTAKSSLLSDMQSLKKEGESAGGWGSVATSTMHQAIASLNTFLNRSQQPEMTPEYTAMNSATTSVDAQTIDPREAKRAKKQASGASTKKKKGQKKKQAA